MDHYVYVIELDDKIGPRDNPDYPCVYVGQSFFKPEERFEQHLAGTHASRHVRKYGKRLLPELYDHLNPCWSRWRAMDMEKLLGEELAEEGYTVYGAH
ncbi:hypothetical protein ACFL39_00635 [Gemmatimonadota bacterium]